MPASASLSKTWRVASFSQPRKSSRGSTRSIRGSARSACVPTPSPRRKETPMAQDLNVDDLFPSKYFKAETDLGKEGAELRVTIANIDVEAVGREKERRPVLSFRDGIKPLILNKTNFTALQKILGRETSGWPGKQITLVAKTVEYGGGLTLGTRIKVPTKPKPEPRQLDHDLNDTIPF